MKKINLLLLVVVCFVQTGFTQLAFKLNSDKVQAYSYAEGDEFNTNSLNTEYWSNGLGWTRVIMSQDLAFSQHLVKISDGTLKLIADKKDSVYILGQHEIDSNYLKKTKLDFTGNKFLTKYEVGCIISKQKLHYGLYELKFKVEEGRGVWPAFWFYGGKENEEIDGFELKGERNDEIHVDTHCPKGCDRGYKGKFSFSPNWGNWVPVSDYLHNGYNTMQLEWSAKEIFWYVNGYPLAYFKGEFPNAMNLYLNTSVAKDKGAFQPGPDTTTKWPNTYSVDYIRIWKENTDTSALILRRSDNINNSAIDTKVVPVKKRGITYKKKEFSNEKGFVFVTLNKENKLSLHVLGVKKDSGTKLSIKGKSFEKEITDLSTPMVLDLPQGEPEFYFNVLYGKKSFQQKIRVKN